MDNFFDKALHYLGRNEDEITALNIGAMDGVMFDEMIGYTNMYDFKVLYVEPIPYLFEKLKSNIQNKGIFENSAISDYDGEIEMITIKKEVIDEGLVHSCFYGMSAVYPPKNGLGSEFDKPTVEKYGELIKVPCITFETLMQKHQIEKFDVVKIDAEGHDYKIFKQIDLNKYKAKVLRLEWINLSEIEQEQVKKIFENNNYIYEISGQDIVGLEKNLYNELKKTYDKNKDNQNKNNKVTLVTGLWDLGRNDLSEGWSRSYENHYLKKFEQLLEVEENMVIFGDKELEKFVWKKRDQSNTQFIFRDLSWFKNNDFFSKIQKIRVDENWYNQVGWLRESTQAKLEMYNPIVMSKMFLLHDAKILEKFDSEYLFWIDAGLTNTVHSGYFTHDRVIEKLPKVIDKFSFVCFPYDTNTEIHGFNYEKLKSLAGSEVKKVARGGFFGGPKNKISEINGIYYNLLLQTLDEGYMGTEESIFSIMCHKNSDLINYYEINGDGLLYKFFEDLKNNSLKTKSEKTFGVENNYDVTNTALYVITFNSPKQFETLIESMIQYDCNFIDKPKKYLLDNSSDDSTYEKYKELCEEFEFEHIKKDNLGICGGRQFIAEHAKENNFDFYFFFEDDMFFHPKKGEVCKNGFNRYTDDLYIKSLEITKKENLDFLKLNYTEFYGDNGTQWSWYNVPQSIREEFWPNNPKLPHMGLDPNAPKTEFKKILSHRNTPYAIGEVYYCNWPQVVTKNGNQKMFLNTTWNHPYEQTWMSHIYQLTRTEDIRSGLLLMTPTEHNRFDFYEGSLRKES